MRMLVMLPVICVAVFSGCTGMKNISAEDPLFTGNEISIIGGKEHVKRFLDNAEQKIQPRPNNRFLWMRPALARHNMLSDSARNKKFWRNKTDEAVLLSQTYPTRASSTLNNRLFHEGFFHNEVTYDTLQHGRKKAGYRFNVELNQPFRLKTVSYPEANDELNTIIASTRDESLLIPGDRYSLQTIKDERIRIDRFLKERGYLYFNPEFILVQADTVSDEYQVNLRILVKPSTPPESRKPYHVNKIYIHDDYDIESYQPDTLDQDSVLILSEYQQLNYRAFQNGLFIKTDELYSQSDVSQTMRYLNKLPIIRSSSIKFVQEPQSDRLDAMLYITKRKRFAYTAELNTIFRSTNYFGPGIVFSYTDRNVKHEANQLSVNLRGRFEVQVADGDVNPAWELGLEVNYRLPRMYPTFLMKKKRRKIPQTIISAGYNLFNRTDLYRLNSTYFDLGYQWSTNDRISHKISPVEMIFTQIPESSISDEFRDYLNDNPGVRRSFDEQFVLGAGYEFTYDPRPRDRGDFFFRGGVDFAGNLLYGTYSVFNLEKNEEGKYDLFGVPFSQYIRTSLDLRYEFNLNQNSSLVTRFFSGTGIPYRNSEILPYVRQFYVGGTNSLRSFIARSVGPGSEVPPEGFRDLTGDIRLEWNLEYRFTIAGNFKSALFLDAGNIWLFNDDPDRPNGVFRFDKLLSELAVSSGFGLRWDFDFVVARLDLAYTLRTPYLPEGERWNKDINIWKPTFNIAIGYPF